MTVETPEFRVAVRGYSRAQVHEVAELVTQVLADDDAAERARLREHLSHASFDLVMRGYDRDEVDAYLDHVAKHLAQGVTSPGAAVRPGVTLERPRFRVVLRGYARAQVDEVVEYVDRVLASPDAAQHARLRERLPDASFDVVVRGYDRAEVQAYLQRVGVHLARLR